MNHMPRLSRDSNYEPPYPAHKILVRIRKHYIPPGSTSAIYLRGEIRDLPSGVANILMSMGYADMLSSGAVLKSAVEEEDLLS